MFIIYNNTLNKCLDEILLYLSKSDNFIKTNNIYNNKLLTFYNKQIIKKFDKKHNINYNNLLLNSYKP